MVTYVGSLIICSLSSRKGAKDAKIPRGYIGLSDLSGLARKDSRKEIISLA